MSGFATKCSTKRPDAKHLPDRNGMNRFAVGRFFIL